MAGPISHQQRRRLEHHFRREDESDASEQDEPCRPQGSSQGPAAPASDELVDGDWLLESYRLENTDSGLVVPATIRNRGEQPASAELTVWVFADQEPLGSVSASVSDVPPDGTQEVTLEGDAVWKPGDKTVLLQAN